MEKCVCIILLLFSLVKFSVSDDSEKQNTTLRKSRNFDNDPEPPVYSDAGSVFPQHREDDDSQHYKKGYYLPYFPTVYKGYPSDIKGVKQISPPPSMAPDQMMEMMNMMNAMMNLEKETSDKEVGFFDKLFSDPKSILVAAIIPVSIMLASFIPLLVNYFTAGASLPSILTSVAGSKMGRNLGDPENFHILLENIVKYGKKFESGDCMEESICVYVTSNSSMDDSLKKVVKSIAKIMKKEWLGYSSIAKILSAVKNGNCSNLCEKSKNWKRKNM